MSTEREIRTMIQTAQVEVSADAINHLLDIASALNERASRIEEDLGQVYIMAKSHNPD